MDTRVAEIITADGTVDRVTWFEPSYVNAKAFARSAVSNGQRPLDTRVKYLRVDRVGDMYEEHFNSLYNIWHKNGWYEKNLDRENLDWLYRRYPNGRKQE